MIGGLFMNFTVFAKEHGFSSYEEMMQSTTTVIYDEFINWNATITNDGWIAWVDDPLGLIGMYETYD